MKKRCPACSHVAESTQREHGQACRALGGWGSLQCLPQLVNSVLVRASIPECRARVGSGGGAVATEAAEGHRTRPHGASGWGQSALKGRWKLSPSEMGRLLEEGAPSFELSQRQAQAVCSGRALREAGQRCRSPVAGKRGGCWGDSDHRETCTLRSQRKHGTEGATEAGQGCRVRQGSGGSCPPSSGTQRA